MDASPSVSAEIVAGDVVTLTDLARQYHTAPCTTFRWVNKGLPDPDPRRGRVFLEAVRRGRIWITSSAAVARFFARLENPRATATPAPFRTPAKRERDHARLEKAMSEKYGI